MTDPSTLFSYERHIDARTLRGETLLVTLGSFGDTGHSQEVLDDHVLNTLSSRVVGRLDMDQIHDYAGRRPEVTLERDRFVDYQKPEILLHEVQDLDGSPFFLLTGPEPSMQWERVVASLRMVTEQLGIRRTIITSSFPAPVPHTRPLQVTRFAADPEDITVRRPMPAVLRLRSSFSALLTLRFGEAGHDVIGLVAHVPQYLADVAYPDAGLALFQAVQEEGGPSIPVGSLEATAESVRAGIDEQVASSEQLQEMIAGLEKHYDRMITASSADQSVPSAEEIGAEVENFLAGLATGDPADDESEDEDPEDGTGPENGPFSAG